MGTRGISAVVAVVMTILITVAAVTIIWVAIVPMVSESIEFSELDGRVSIVSSGGWTVYDAEKDVAIVQVKRDVDEGVMNRIKISFVIDGNSVSSTVVAPESGQTKTYTFDLSVYGEPEGVSVAPIFVSDSGKEKEGNVQSKVDVPSGNIGEVDADVYELERDYFYEMPMTGLVSWWKFDGDANDSVGENDGENNGVTFDNGFGVFDGVGGCVSVPNDESLNFETNEDFSISVWAKTVASTTQEIYSKFEANWAKNQYTLYMDAGVGKARFIFGDSLSSPSLYSEYPLNDGDWHHVLVTFGRTEKAKMYVDSVLQSGDIDVTTLGAIKNSASLKIGSNSGCGQNWNGSIDNVMIYNKALTQEEIAAIYENQMK